MSGECKGMSRELEAQDDSGMERLTGPDGRKLLSIVVPAYNAENYLSVNLDSLCLPEALKDIEVLVIDDGSTDGTGRIAGQYEKKYPETVRVITKENGGHGSGINRGIAEARGLYFKVVDADDWVERNAFLHLLTFLKEQAAAEGRAADLIASGFYWVFDDGSGRINAFRRKAEFKKPFSGVRYRQVYHFDDIADKLYIKMHAMTIRTELLKCMIREYSLTIDENCYYVDAEYILYPIPFVETVAFLPDFVYQYRIGRSGQSVSLEKMQKNEANYDKVLRSLFLFYDRCRKEDITCSLPKVWYIAHVTARIVAGKIKILLSYPPSRSVQRQLKEFDRNVRKQYPDIYRANINRGVKLLRKSRFRLYPVAEAMLRRKDRLNHM